MKMHKSIIVLVISALAFGQFAQAQDVLTNNKLAEDELLYLKEDFAEFESLCEKLNRPANQEERMSIALFKHLLTVAYKQRELIIKSHLLEGSNAQSFTKQIGEELHVKAYEKMLPHFLEASKFQTKDFVYWFQQVLEKCEASLRERLNFYFDRGELSHQR
jgi:hypothetical protein